MSDLIAILQVLLIDITLAGDNAVVVGLAVAGLPGGAEAAGLVGGVLAAAVIRIALSAVAIRLLAVVGLTLAGGLLLLWVCWKMYRELRAAPEEEGGSVVRKTIGQAIKADIDRGSVDEPGQRAGGGRAARSNLWIMAGGLALSVLLMGAAANLLARLLVRFRWIAWVGLAVGGLCGVRDDLFGLGASGTALAGGAGQDRALRVAWGRCGAPALREVFSRDA